MNIIDNKRFMQYAWNHKHMVYSYLILRIAMVSPARGLNAFLHRLRGVKVGKNVKISHDVLLDPVEPGSIMLEDNVIIGTRVTIFAHTNPTLPLYEYIGGRTVEPVQIKEGASIEMGAFILPGVTVGRCAVVRAGAVVTKDIPDFTVAEGIPAKQVGSQKNEIPLT
ncbi:MAG: acyltransferase [Theionarchaea archaeon]|nr:acyltransferase [Theionarchaea archaeon]